VSRRELSFDSAGTRCAAWLYGAPESGDAGRPCVVLAHIFGGVGSQLAGYGERFADAGLAALVFDYRHLGESAGEPRQLLDIRRQLDDWRAAIGFARSLEGVDPDRIVLWGASFSGGHVARVAADDARVAAAISLVPFTDGPSALRAAGLPDVSRLAVAGVRDEISRLRGRPPFTIPIAGPPGRTAVMNSPDADPGYRAIFPPEAGFRNEIAARIGLHVGFYLPFRQAPRIACPWLVCVADDDLVTPPQPAIKAALRAPRGELRRYRSGHFDIFGGELFDQSVADQIDFLSRHGLTPPATPPRPAGQPGR
jgi:fermentation-respiration switch protein FrsA (DUF1100 family)